MFLTILLLLTQCYRISQNPVGVPKEPYETPENANSLFGFFVHLCSQNLANKVFLKNGIGQDNLLLIQQKLFPGDIEDDSLNDIYSDCAARGSVNNTNISNSIGSVRNLYYTF